MHPHYCKKMVLSIPYFFPINTLTLKITTQIAILPNKGLLGLLERKDRKGLKAFPVLQAQRVPRVEVLLEQLEPMELQAPQAPVVLAPLARQELV